MLTKDEDVVYACVVPDKQIKTDEAGEDDRHCEDAVDEEQAVPGRYRCPRLRLETCAAFVRSLVAVRLVCVLRYRPSTRAGTPSPSSKPERKVLK